MKKQIYLGCLVVLASCAASNDASFIAGFSPPAAALGYTRFNSAFGESQLVLSFASRWAFSMYACTRSRRDASPSASSRAKSHAPIKT